MKVGSLNAILFISTNFPKEILKKIFQMIFTADAFLRYLILKMPLYFLGIA